jgi:hypothetical protein
MIEQRQLVLVSKGILSYRARGGITTDQIDECRRDDHGKISVCSCQQVSVTSSTKAKLILGGFFSISCLDTVPDGRIPSGCAPRPHHLLLATPVLPPPITTLCSLP